MNLNQLSDQLKDVPQNRLIDYAQNPNSVVPQFLALAEIQRRQQLSAQAQPPQSTVANDVLAQAQPPMPQQMPPQGVVSMQQPQQQMAQQLPENQPGVSQLPSGMPQGMAAGGIVAFADGGLSLDEDTDEDREMAQLFPTNRLAGINEMLASMPGKAREMMSNISAPREDTKLKQATMHPNAPETSARKGGHKYEQDVLAEAKRQGVDPALALHVLYKETGNLKDPETARSKAGALGVMQLMPKTAAGLGVDPTNPMENIRGGVTYLKQMADKYKENRLAAAAYNAGPGNLDKALRRQGGLDTLPNETRNYIAGLAQGGEVKGYSGEDGESDVKEDNDYLKRSRSVVDTVKSAYDALTTPKNYDLYDMYQRNIGQPFSRGVDRFVNEPLESQAERFRSYSMTPDKAPTVGYNTPAGTSTPAPTSMTRAEADRLAAVSGVNRAANKEGLFSRPVPQYGAPSSDELKNMDIGFGPGNYGPSTNPTVNAPSPKSKADLYAEALEKDIERQAAKAAKDGDINLAMSIMSAGMKMMASKSPYALGGIGEGGEQGINTFATLKKQESDKAKDLMAARLGLYKYGAAQEGAAETREANRLYREGETYRKTNEAEERSSDRAFLRYGTRIKQIEDAIMKSYAEMPMYKVNPEKFAGEIQAKIAAAKASDQLLNTLAQRAGIGASPAVQVGPVIVQTPKGAVSFPSQAAADEFKRKAGIK